MLNRRITLTAATAVALSGVSFAQETLETAATLPPMPTNFTSAPPIATLDERAGQFEQVWRTFPGQDRARIIVRLDVPEYDALRRVSIAARNQEQALAADAALESAIQAAAQQLLGELTPNTFEVTGSFRTLPFAALEVDMDALAALELHTAVLGISVDHVVRAQLNNTTHIVQADTVWQAGAEGNGWYVAILDTGIRGSHQAFQSKNVVQACFSIGDNCPNGTDTDTTSPNAAAHFAPPYDSDHGTHVAGIAAGDDPVGPIFHDGVARGANIIAIQVFHRSTCDNNEPCVHSSSSSYVRAMDWLYTQRFTYRIAALNLSLGGGRYYDQATCDLSGDLTNTAAANLRSVGIATIAASGNDGYCDSLAHPACVSNLVAVGATDDDDNERGSSNYHSGMLDLYAPGDSVRAPIGSGDNDYGDKSGTSMASPHVAGAYALMRSAIPNLTLDEILASLQASGASITGRCTALPAIKRINVFDALHRAGDTLSTWVRVGYVGVEAGFWFAPFNTLAEGVQVVPAGGTLWLYEGHYQQAITINKAMTIRVRDSVARIGS